MKKILKYSILFSAIACLLMSCRTTNGFSSEKMVNDYYSGLSSGNFDLFAKYLADDVKTVEMDQVLTTDIEGLKTQYRWDSVFKPKYRIMDLSENEDSVYVTISKNCIRTRFLQDSALIYKATFVVSDEKIQSIETTDYVYLNLEKWPVRRDSLVSWTERNHPNLSGFIYDLTPEGAEKYLKAMELYSDQKDL